MKTLRLFLMVFALSPAFPAWAEDGWCYENAQKDPKYPFRVLVSFSMELNARKNDGLVTEEDFDWAYGELGRANELLGRNEPKAGCLLIEEIEREYHLLPKN